MHYSLTDEEKRLCKVSLAHAILRCSDAASHEEKDYTQNEPKQHYNVPKAIAAWREAYPRPILNSKPISIMSELEALACLPMDSGVLRTRFFHLVRSSINEATLTQQSFTTWIPVRGWELITSSQSDDTALVRTMDALRLLSRMKSTVPLAPAVLCGLHTLASRIALELVDASSNEQIYVLIGRSKAVLDTFADVILLMAIEFRGATRQASQTKEHLDAVALSEMLARLVLDFEHVPLVHAYLVLLSEQILPLITAPPAPRRTPNNTTDTPTIAEYAPPSVLLPTAELLNDESTK
mmetsp:Transcript_3276/g.4544  ORF Transcript_3276/g.4544 Transcript_3276/m.4544 type:complete len:295 (+) Transcript_3276:50-934(+)